MAETTALMLSDQSNMTVIGNTTFLLFGLIINDYNSSDVAKYFNWNNFTISKTHLSITVLGVVANTKSIVNITKSIHKKGYITDVGVDNQFDRSVSNHTTES